ncbi:MAG: bifunctional D-glycero-beta-D-manno-heptose-7-phosphate kinase/D-glycero-beta-D-manno-heptose 1-phosphate adenylyltransferase HldE [Pseudomonadota bacterium]
MPITVPDFSQARVVVAGDVMLDEYWFGATSRISPEAPVPVVHVGSDEARPGGAANVAINLAALGARTALTGVVGNDAAAGMLGDLITEAGIEHRFVVHPDMPTISKLRVLSRGQQLIRLDREDHGSAGPSLNAPLEKLLGAADALVLSDYAKGALSDVQALIELARERHVPVLVDPKGTEFVRYRGATLLTPNQSEFEAVVGPCKDDADLVAKARALINELDLAALLVTRSERGMLLVDTADAEPFFLSTVAREVFDVTGAGDTVIATLAAALAAGCSRREAATLANLAAGLVVRKVGVASVTPAEMRDALHQRGTGGRGVQSAATLVDLRAAARTAGQRVVMTNGVFDILHAGHVAYLEEAKSLGDRLIVAVNDDASVRRLKGDSRPVNPLEDRLAVLAGLAAVDWVVPFAEDTPAALIEHLSPDVLVKGGDYRVEEIAGGAHVLESGGEVRVLAFRPGRSSTRIIEAIRGQ